MTDTQIAVSPQQIADEFFLGARSTELRADEMAVVSLWATVTARTTNPAGTYVGPSARARACDIIADRCGRLGPLGPLWDEALFYVERAERALNAAGIVAERITRVQLHDLGTELMAELAPVVTEPTVEPEPALTAVPTIEAQPVARQVVAA